LVGACLVQGCDVSGYAAARRRAPDRFAITVPESWFALDLRSGMGMRSIDPLVQARIRGTPMLAGRRAVMSAALRDAARRATTSGAVYCGVIVEAVDGAGLSATVSVSSSRHDAGPGEPVPTVGELVLRLQEEPPPSLPGT
jgi:hypothetical protein